MKQKVMITCPACGLKGVREVETRINTATQPELKRALLQGELQQFTCENCGAKRQIQSEMFYHDPKGKYIIYNIPSLKRRYDEVEEMIDKAMQEVQEDTTDYTLRLVGLYPELIEKSQIFDHGYDDRVVEIVKLLTDGLFAKDRPNDKVVARYFFMHEGEPKIMYITDKDQILVDFNENLLKFSREKFDKINPKPGEGHFHLVNAEWAAHALSQS